MDDNKHENKLHALNNAVRHRLNTETPDDIVTAAKKYFEFLQEEEKETT